MKIKNIAFLLTLICLMAYFFLIESKNYTSAFRKNTYKSIVQNGYFLTPTKYYSNFFTKCIIAKGVLNKDTIGIKISISLLNETVVFESIGQETTSMFSKGEKNKLEINKKYIFHNFGDPLYFYDLKLNTLTLTLFDDTEFLTNLVIDIPNNKVRF